MRTPIWTFFTLRRFAPLFATQFLGALNDHLLKNAIAVLVVFRLAGPAGLDGNLLVALGAGVFVLPFFLFSTLAGQIADRFAKSRIVQVLKGVEVGLMALAVVGLTWGNMWFLLGVLFLMGTQSAFFSPAKYALLPEILREDELVAGNGVFEAGVYLAILAGTIAGAQLILAPHGTIVTAAALIVIAALGFAASLWVLPSRAVAPNVRVSWNVPAEMARIVGHARQNRPVFLSILGTAWFWTVGVVYLTEFPAWTRNVLGANEDVVTLFLGLFSVGIGLGSLACDKLLKGEVEATWVPVGALGIALFSADLFFASEAARVVDAASLAEADLMGVGAFLARPESWRIVADLALVAFSGGLYAVPLYAIMQNRTEEAHRSRTLAANNIISSFFTVIGAAAVAGLVAAGLEVMDIFLIFAVFAFFVALKVCALLPVSLIKAILSRLFVLLWRAEVEGLEHLKAAGDKAILVVNHVSLLDGILLAVLLPGRFVYAVNVHWAAKWWVGWALALAEVFTVDPMKPMGLKGLVAKVREGRRCVIFPEGRVTVTGALMKVYEGPGMLAEKADAPVVPVRIEGPQYTIFSRLGGKVRRKWFPKIRIVVHPPLRFEVDPALKGRARRAAAADRLHAMMTDAAFRTYDADVTLFEALLDARALYGGGFEVIEDVERKPMSYDRIITASLTFAAWLKRRSKPGEAIGIMLPTSGAAAIVFFACQAAGRVAAMLNFSAGPAALEAAAETAGLKTVLTSRRFIERGRLQEAVDALAKHADIVFLEDVRARMGIPTKLTGLLGSWRRKIVRRRRPAEAAGRPAVILFTSGSEGKPKAVLLSHRNLMTNRWQLTARIAFNSSDRLLNALPVFHAFGLTGGLLLPLLSGVPSFQYPSPLHYRIVPELAYDFDATILFATDTFLAGWARMAHPYDFHAVRQLFSGAEKLREETRKVWMEKFGIRVLEGYGVTETSPAIAAATPMHYRAGSVGRFLPGIEWRLEPVPGLDRGGRLEVRGGNVMLGYIDAEAPDGLRAPPGGWYDTGDIIEVDAEGFVRIVGRLKRFAKIGGEMVSLAVGEDIARAAWPEADHAAVALPDPRKGERIVIATTQPDARADDLAATARARGAPEIAVPRQVCVVPEIPLLGSGKPNYPKITTMVADMVSGSGAEDMNEIEETESRPIR
ncbi:MAG: acyl-[ACP]--phospholipid O-acyltransferase [Rhodospirillales bacterium]|nr:acyl-[ACP]--phospholipid O-acyltransferase [Rhodospirillales bacterium]